MAALEAQFELRSSVSTRWIPGSRFSTPGAFTMAPQELLTRIRVPLEQWNYSLYRKFKSPLSDESEGVMVFILKNQKDILTDLRVVFAGNTLLHNRQIEASLIGKRLPLDRKEALSFRESWKLYLENNEALKDPAGIPLVRYPVKITWAKTEKPELLKAQIMNFIEDAILGISD
jgi:hypothetical protein